MTKPKSKGEPDGTTADDPQEEAAAAGEAAGEEEDHPVGSGEPAGDVLPTDDPTDGGGGAGPGASVEGSEDEPPETRGGSPERRVEAAPGSRPKDGGRSFAAFYGGIADWIIGR